MISSLDLIDGRGPGFPRPPAAGKLALEHGFPNDDGPWAGRGDTSSDPPAVEFIYYDDLCFGGRLPERQPAAPFEPFLESFTWFGG